MLWSHQMNECGLAYGQRKGWVLEADKLSEMWANRSETKTSLWSAIGHFKTQTNRIWWTEVRAAVSDQGPWEKLGTVPVEEPSVWLQASHSASSSLPPCSFNYRAWASSTQERCLGEGFYFGKLGAAVRKCSNCSFTVSTTDMTAVLQWGGGHQTSWAG